MNHSAMNMFSRTVLAILLSAMLLGLPASGAVQAAKLTAPSNTITVNDTSPGTGGPGCKLRDAIIAANTDGGAGGCSAGSGADVIELAKGATYTLDSVDNGINGLPAITTEITINGNGATIERSSAGGTPAFRFFLLNSGANLTLNNLTLSNGRTETNSDGGAIRVSVSGSVLNLNNSTLIGNTATSSSSPFNAFGGAIAVKSGATANVTNSTISGNSAYSGGGGIGNQGTLSIFGSTITGNTADMTGVDPTDGNGGGVSQRSGTTTVRNTIIAGNADDSTTTEHPDVSGAFTSGGRNLIGKSDGSTGFGGTDQVGTIAAPLDPLLSALANNGGPTQTHALDTGSPAIDAIPTGSLRSSAAQPANCTHDSLDLANSSFDQRGVYRADGVNTGAACDIGAFEYGATPTAVTIATFSSQTAWGSGPQLTWETADESGLSGFHIWRGSTDAAETRLTDELIGAAGGLTGNAYTWQDAVSFGWGQREYYWLEAVAADGSSNFTGPVEVVGIGRLFLPMAAR